MVSTGTSAGTEDVDSLANSVAAGDFNGDGAIDFIGGLDDDGDAGQVWMWEGQPFAPSTLPSGQGVEAFDVNGDGEFDMDDVLHMLRMSHDAFDMDGDGDVDCDDLRIMCCPCCTGNAVKISMQPGGSHPEHDEHDDPAKSAPGGGGGVPPLS